MIPECIIERKNNLQSEWNQHTDSITGYKVKWVDSCSYELTEIYKVKRGTVDTVFSSENVILNKVKITKTTNDYFVFQSEVDNYFFIYKDTMWKIE